MLDIQFSYFILVVAIIPPEIPGKNLSKKKLANKKGKLSLNVNARGKK